MADLGAGIISNKMIAYNAFKSTKLKVANTFSGEKIKNFLERLNKFIQQRFESLQTEQNRITFGGVHEC